MNEEHFRKYESIKRMGHRDSHGVLQEGDVIAVWEKLDGSNASFKLVGGEIHAFSRNLPLDEENDLNGFYQWTQTLDKEKITPGITYYGEWVIPHKVDYGENARQFYLFDVWQPKVYGIGGKGYEYAGTWEVVFEAEELGINLAPLLYVGHYKGHAHLQSLVGRSALATDPTKGEGIIIKNHNYLNKQGSYVWLKMVSESFAEVKKVKPPRDPALDNEATRLARECTTLTRVEKAVERLIERDDIPREDFEMTNMGKLIPVVGEEVAIDIIAEEAPEDYDEQYLKDVRRMLGKLVPGHLRKIIEIHEMEAME
ncbi:MAG: RNA ligase family protein [Actinobacteria bacterium]|nr:RNA ligase family protein [Actinomycetota bacterium]